MASSSDQLVMDRTDDQKRAHRHNCAQNIRGTPAYTKYVWLRERFHIDAIDEPDPDDLSLSKREWEKAMLAWRKELFRVTRTVHL